MDRVEVKCVVLADRHHTLVEGIRGLLETTFDAIVMVADEKSLLESVERLQPMMAVVDLSLARRDSLRWLQQLRERYPNLKLILLSVHSEASVCQSALAAGANGYVLKCTVATELLPAIDAVLDGQQYISQGIAKTAKADEAKNDPCLGRSLGP